MPNLSFNNQALSAGGQTPRNLNWSLSGTGNAPYTVELLTVAAGVRGIAFNSPPTVTTGIYRTLSVFPGTSIRVDQGYNGARMAVINNDRSSSLFVVATGASTTVQSTTANGFDSVTPEVRRLTHLGY